MKKPDKIKAFVFITAGAVLIMSALLLFLANSREDIKAGESARQAVSELERAISEKTVSGRPVKQEPDEKKVVFSDGFGYIGILTVPALGLRLPVMSDWDFQKLKIAPCRHFGSAENNDLVIAAHNYKSHFGNLKFLKPGDAVSFTSLDGILHEYTVVHLETLKPTQVDEVQNSGHALVLYTCTPGGRTRVTVFCDKHENEN